MKNKDEDSLLKQSLFDSDIQRIQNEEIDAYSKIMGNRDIDAETLLFWPTSYVVGDNETRTPGSKSSVGQMTADE